LRLALANRTAIPPDIDPDETIVGQRLQEAEDRRLKVVATHELTSEMKLCIGPGILLPDGFFADLELPAHHQRQQRAAP
jgi:hypothetical protein